MPDSTAAVDQRGAGPPPTLVVLGASVRAVAESARRSGWRVHAADLFADLDLVAAAETVHRIARAADGDDGYPDGLAAAAAGFPPGPWCYTGAVENHPGLIDRIAAVRPLAGNDGQRVRRVRDPFVLGRAIREAGLHHPDTHADPAGLPRDGSFLVKPLSSAGGRGIRGWTDAVAADIRTLAGPIQPGPFVWQRRVSGAACSAAFIAGPGGAELVGLTRQYVGMPWCHAAPFAYCGSLQWPLASVAAGLRRHLDRLGAMLAGRLALVGAVGVDIVVTGEGRMVVIEVNPRPTASMELFERAGGPAVVAAHLAACGFESPAGRAVSGCDAGGLWSKAVLFARHDVAVTDALVARLREADAAWRSGDWPALADIPRPGQAIPAGGPVLTIFHQAVGNTPRADAPPAELVARVRRIDALL